MYISGAACTESEGATLSTFLVLSFFIVSRLLSMGWGLVGGHVERVRTCVHYGGLGVLDWWCQ